MTRAELAVGDEVFVRLSYHGGTGWAQILDLDAEPPRFGRKTETVRWSRSTPARSRFTYAAHVTKLNGRIARVEADLRRQGCEAIVADELARVSS